MNNDIYQIDFTQIFPTALQHDPKMIALAKSLTAELLTVSGHMEDVLIYSRIDQLPEELVDILAYDMHVDWYSYEDPLAVKRQTLKDSVKVHKHMGTKYAVETAIQAFFPGGTVQEWFDYEGEPHHFRITIPLPGGITPEVLDDLKRRIWHVKRLSSWLDTIITEPQMEKTVYVGPGACHYETARTGTYYGADAAIHYTRAGGWYGGYAASAAGTGLPGGGGSGPNFGGHAQYHGNGPANTGGTRINAVSADSGPRFGGGAFYIGNVLAAAV